MPRLGLLLSVVWVWAALLGAASASAQGISLNYETLSSLEEPIATELGDVTLALTGLLDTPFSFGIEDSEDDVGFVGNFEASLKTQLPNRWRVGLAYFGQYSTDPTTTLRPEKDYRDNLGLSVGGSWGTFLVGNASGFVREQTRRRRSVGSGRLAFDDLYGELEDWSAGYLVRSGPWVLSALVGEGAHFDLGVVYQRPTGNKDYRLSLRYAQSEYESQDRLDAFDSRAMSVVGEFIYSRFLFDVGVGFERFDSDRREAERWYVSPGIRAKIGVVGLSLEGHYGEI